MKIKIDFVSILHGCHGDFFAPIQLLSNQYKTKKCKYVLLTICPIKYQKITIITDINKKLQFMCCLNPVPMLDKFWYSLINYERSCEEIFTPTP